MALNSGIFTLQEFKNRGVIKLAPDALVYIGGNLETQVIAPIAGQNTTLNFNDGITNIGIQSSVDPPGSSTATIEVMTPIYGENSKYWVNFTTPEGMTTKMPIFIPMLEVKIFLKGRFLVNDKPRYYPAFWGLITNVEENYSDGMFKFTLQCADMLHWWQYSTINVHPTVQDDIAAGGGLNLTVYATIFDKANPFQIIAQLVKGMGLAQFVQPVWLGQITPQKTIYESNLFRRVATGLSEYWRQRFTIRGGILKMYGASGQRVDANGVSTISPTSVDPNKANNSEVLASTLPNVKANYAVDQDFLRRFTVFFEFDKMGSFENSEYMTKLQIATEVKSRIDFEFYQDVNGNLIFKPPFYNIDVKSLLPYNIKPNDILSSSFGVDSEGIITCIQVHTSFHEQLRHTSYARGEGFHIDIDLAKKYGLRFHEIPLEYITDPNMARQLALGQMNLINTKTVTGNVTIPGRPEIRLGYPIYVPHRDSYHYVKSINHSFDFAGSFITTLSLETERKRVYAFDTQWGELQKNKVYVYSEALLPDPPLATSTKDDPPKVYSETAIQKQARELLASNQRVVSIPQGRYEIMDADKAAQQTGHTLPELVFVTDKTVPFTDEQGYRLVGSFPYGRGVNPVCIGTDITITPYSATNIEPASVIESKSMIQLFFNDKEGAVPSFLLSDPSIVDKDGSKAPNVTPVDQAKPDQSAQPLAPPETATTEQSNRKPTGIRAGKDAGPPVNKTLDQQAQNLSQPKSTEGWYQIAGIPAPSADQPPTVQVVGAGSTVPIKNLFLGIDRYQALQKVQR